MDDLLHSLGTPGKGTHSRTRPEVEVSAGQGAAFEAAFESLPATGDEWAALVATREDVTPDVIVQLGGDEKTELNAPFNQPIVSTEAEDAALIETKALNDAAELIPSRVGAANPVVQVAKMPSQMAAVVSILAAEPISFDGRAGQVAPSTGLQAEAALDEVFDIVPSKSAPASGDMAKQVAPVSPPTGNAMADTKSLKPNDPQITGKVEARSSVAVPGLDEQSAPPRVPRSTLPLTHPGQKSPLENNVSFSDRNLLAPVSESARQNRMGDQKAHSVRSPEFADSTEARAKTLGPIAAVGSSQTTVTDSPSSNQQAPTTTPLLTRSDTLPLADEATKSLARGPETAEPRRSLSAQIPEREAATDTRLAKTDLPVRANSPQSPPPTLPNAPQTATPQWTSLPVEDEARPQLPRIGDPTPERTGRWTTVPTTHSGQAISAPMPSVLQSNASVAATSIPADPGAEPLTDLDFTVQSMSTTTTGGISSSAFSLTQAPSATAQVIAQQIAAALSRTPSASDTPLELALDPPELGRLRMQITEIAGVMTLMIQAERPETADLMRRHLDLLAQEFAQEGMDAPSVHISGESADENGHSSRDEHPDQTTPLLLDENSDTSNPQSIHTASSGLDLRL